MRYWESMFTFGDWIQHIDFPETHGKIGEVAFGDDGHTYYKIDNYIGDDLKTVVIRADLVRQIERPTIAGFRRDT